MLWRRASPRRIVEVVVLIVSISTAWVHRSRWARWIDVFLAVGPDLESGHDLADDVYNRTLGFQKIFYISLPDRLDRQHSMQLLANATDLDLVLHHGVPGASVYDKSTGGRKNPNVTPAQVGCRLAHVQLWERIVREGVDTALILEDDLDWDLNIHMISEQLSRQMAASKLMSKASERDVVPGPYALNWEVLYVGACYDVPLINKTRSHHAYYDPLGPAWEDISRKNKATLKSWGIEKTEGESIRLIVPSSYPPCTMGYAVTQAGAKKLVDRLGDGDYDDDDVVPEHDVEPGWSENLKASTRLYVGRNA